MYKLIAFDDSLFKYYKTVSIVHHLISSKNLRASFLFKNGKNVNFIIFC